MRPVCIVLESLNELTCPICSLEIVSKCQIRHRRGYEKRNKYEVNIITLESSLLDAALEKELEKNTKIEFFSGESSDVPLN